MSDRPISDAAAATIRRWAARAGVPVEQLADLLRAYTSGERRPSDADALLLVERHLGDPARLSELLGRAHGRPATSFFRRGAAALVATCTAMAIMRVGYAAWVYRTQAGRFSVFTVQDADVIWWLADAIVPVIVGGLLLLWSRAERANGRPWYVRRGGATVALVATAALVAHLAVPVAIDTVCSPHVFSSIAHAVPASGVVSWAVIAGSALSYLATAWMWTAFIDHPRWPHGGAWVLVGWVAFWGITASFYAGWVYSPVVGDYVFRPSLAVLPGFETELTWAGILIGGTLVVAATQAVRSTARLKLT